MYKGSSIYFNKVNNAGGINGAQVQLLVANDNYEQQNLETAQMVYFDTMLFANDEMQFSSVKAASNSYPLKGQLKVKAGLNAETEVAPGAPTPGNVWLSESVFYSLNIRRV